MAVCDCDQPVNASDGITAQPLSYTGVAPPTVCRKVQWLLTLLKMSTPACHHLFSFEPMNECLENELRTDMQRCHRAVHCAQSPARQETAPNRCGFNFPHKTRGNIKTLKRPHVAPTSIIAPSDCQLQSPCKSSHDSEACGRRHTAGTHPPTHPPAQAPPPCVRRTCG